MSYWDSSASQQVSFPVVTAASLEPLRPRRFRTRQRDIRDLPVQVPGTALIFQTNDRFELPPPGQLRMSSDLIVNASAAVIVSLSEELIAVEVELPSSNTVAAVVVWTKFHCLVTDPVQVMKAGCWHVQKRLESYLLADEKLYMLGIHPDIADSVVARRIMTRVKALDVVEPVAIPGLSARLTGVKIWINDGEGAHSWKPEANPFPGKPSPVPDEPRDGYPFDYHERIEL